jgi:hypothetical protein
MNGLIKEFLKLKDRIQNTSISKKELIEKYNKLKKDEPTMAQIEHTYKNIFKYQGDLSERDEHCICGICFNELHLDKLMVICPTCSNILHINCMKKWMNMGKETCVYCRSPIWQNYKKEESREKKYPSKKYKSLGDM